MDLTPVSKHELETGVLFVDAIRRQQIGLTTAKVEKRKVTATVNATGRVTWDETSLHDVSVKVRGWIRSLRANETGRAVRAGQTLFTVYSPELLAAQQELIAALGSGGSERLVEAAKRKLRLWDVPPGVIAKVVETREAIEEVPFVSPVSGVVVEKDVVEGGAIEPMKRLLRLAGTSKVWIEAEVYEADLPSSAVGQPATVSLAYLPGRTFEGKVRFVLPWLDEKSRTGRVRIELSNRDGALNPGMWASVKLEQGKGEQLVVPDSAVIHAGRHRVVFVDLGEGRLRPQEIQTGATVGGDVVVVSGLSEGETVVTAAAFLVASESRLKSALEVWE